MSQVLIIDDEPAICWALEKFVTRRGHHAHSVASAEEGLALLGRERPDLVLLDVALPGMNGLDALERIRATDDPPPVVVITAHGTMDNAVEAMRRGAFDYLTKPIDLATADSVLTRALAPLERAHDVAAPARDGRARLVGSTAEMQRVYKQIGTLAASDASVLVLGESGTGKELVARTIHEASRRAAAAFEPLVCASLSESLLESELYGHEEGAFTGATRQRIGRLERAHGGTLFLDEVSEIPPATQVKLLRFLQERTIERVGGGEPIALDVRLIAATNRPLAELVRQGRFREDLYYRLKVVEVTLPPLRQRAADIPELVGAFLFALGHTGGVSREALAILARYYWPGNVRELRHAVEHAVALARGALVAPEHLPPYLANPPAPREEELQALVRAQVEAELARGCDTGLYDRLLARWEPAVLAPVMAHLEGNQLRAAQLLGLSRGTLRKKLREHGMLDDKDD